MKNLDEASPDMKKAILSASLLNIGRLLPPGVEIQFFRLPDDQAVYMQTSYPDGEITEHRFTSHAPIFQVPSAKDFV